MVELILTGNSPVPVDFAAVARNYHSRRTSAGVAPQRGIIMEEQKIPQRSKSTYTIYRNH